MPSAFIGDTFPSEKNADALELIGSVWIFRSFRTKFLEYCSRVMVLVVKALLGL
ncbi:MAG: hypothetical protein WCF28_03915 [Methanobacterium sp.]|uniref:hypothetical protein n=1 Tax=Methanobacterium sp. TaxID=2164 RepID=UPI003C769189